MRIDSWTDYSVAAFFEIDPKDLRNLLTVRSYEEEKVPPTLGMEIAEFRPPFPASVIPNVPKFGVKHYYQWEQNETSSRCQLWVSGDFTKAYLHYSTD
ncbi:hypothetical protein OKA05_23760 [Luteolibacter arcticus]|uniref:Uncharacterized protein n=1 Tax=Luteolibacter arcticus TaxID=1581411 RepID=A0ABT3GQ37_9BACT|nr:hypothetical protein [Luteolibacter arcticus]MCW1925595.1 hypothetical protein [Luteolibacter arcticus]